MTFLSFDDSLNNSSEALYETIGKRELFLDKKKITWPGKTAFNKG